MEYAFENRCELKESMLLEFFRKRMRPFKIFMAVMSAIYALEVVLLLALGEPFTGRMLFGIAFFMAVPLLLGWADKFTVKASMRKTAKRCGGTIPESVVRFGDCIETNYCGGLKTYKYAQITGIYLLSNGVALPVKKNEVFLLTGDGFTKGDFAAFQQFIQEKRPDLKVHR